MSARARLVALVLLTIACNTSQPQPRPIEGRPLDSNANNPPPAKTEAELQAITRPRSLGPASDASLEDRRAAVLALLTDGITAEHLSLDVVDFGLDFDPDLAERPPGPGARPLLRHGKVTTAGEGQLDLDVIRRIVLAHQADIRGCHARVLAANPGVRGRLIVEFEIASDGTVGGAKVTDTTVESKPLADCVLESMKSWSFPRPQGGTLKVTYPFVFTSGG